MSRYSSTNCDETAKRKNRTYFMLRRMLPTLEQRVRFSPSFKLQNEEWRCAFHLCGISLRITVNCVSSDIADEFNVLAGIIVPIQKEIAVSKAKPLSHAIYRVDPFICCSELYSLFQAYRGLVFFLEIERKSEGEMERKRKDELKEQKIKFFKGKYRTDFQEMLLSGIKHDFIINVKHRRFYCHTNILSARSPVFSAMLEYEMKEKCTGEVFITDSEPNTFQGFLLYLYTGSEEYLNWERVLELYRLGDKYCVQDLKYLCTEYMKMNMLTKNFFDIFLLSQQHSDSELSEATIQFFLHNYEEIIESEKWDEFMKSNPNEAYILEKVCRHISDRVLFV